MRLIDADALQALFNVVSTSLLGDAELCKDTEHMVRAFIMTTEMIQDAPTIDAVPVVRCKDCKYYKPDEYEFGCECDSGLVYVKANDDFCSYGERRTGGMKNDTRRIHAQGASKSGADDQAACSVIWRIGKRDRRP